MKIIGICGSSGSGKSTVCDFLSARGIPILNCDDIYHELVNTESDCLKEIGNVFGGDLIQSGSLDRKALGRIVFSDRRKMEKLNAISHFYVRSELKKEIEKLSGQNFDACAIDAPMLFEAGLDRDCDLVCAVVADPNLQIERVCARDGISREEALGRLSNQILPLELRAKADVVIENNGDFSHLENCCNKLIDRIHALKGN